MPKRGRKFITQFLVPNLNKETFGSRLAWVDRHLSIFQMLWNHKAASAWTEDDCQVFVEWDKKQGHYRPMEKEYFTKSKQRFRAVLNKSIRCNEITPLQSEDKNIKLYFLGSIDAVPDVKFEIVKDSRNDEKDIESYFLDDLGNIPYFLEQDQLSNTNFHCNALKDHNYQTTEECAISESDYSTNYDASKIELSFYLDSNEENISASSNNLQLPSDEGLGENDALNPEIGHNFLPDYDGLIQVIPSVDAHALANLMQDSSSSISIKREIGHFDDRPTKKSKILVYLQKP